MNLTLDRHVFHTLFSERDPSTATELLMTAIIEKMDKHCRLRSVKCLRKTHLIWVHYWKFCWRRNTNKNLPDEHRSWRKPTEESRTRLSRTLKAQRTNLGLLCGGRQPITCSGREKDTQQRWTSTWKRWINISQTFAGTRTISLQEKQKIEERHHWRSRRISCIENYSNRETLHLGKLEYPPGFSTRMHKTLHSHSSTSLITVSHEGSFQPAWKYPKSFLYLELQRPEVWMI